MFLIQVGIEIMITNKSSGCKFAQYIDEFHTVRHIPGVMQILNKFVRICRSHNGGAILVDQGLGVVQGEASLEYKEIFELAQYGFYFKSPENDINKLSEMLAASGKPLSDVEHKFVARAKKGECLTVMSA
jgi:type IV secretory pathway VirB4 component